jgi:uncharacterized delta-60 repeat protein
VRTPSKVLQAAVGFVVLFLAGIPSANAQPGASDHSFGGRGWVTSDFGGHDEAAALAVGRRIVVAGSSHGNVLVAVYLRDGRLDGSVQGGAGAVTTDLGGHDRPVGVATGPEGGIFVVTDSGTTTGYFSDLLKYRADGTPDSSFSGGGLVQLPDGIFGRALALQPDGRIVVVADEQGGDVHVLRYGVHGGADHSWSGDGDVTVNFGTINDFATGVIVQPDGRILVLGYSVSCPTEECEVIRVALARLTPAGHVDAGFGSDGQVERRFSDREPAGVGLQSDGGIVVATGLDGLSCPSTGLLTGTLHRFHADGTIDHAFGGAGSVAIHSLQASDVAVAADDRILVGGTECVRRSPSTFAPLASMARYLPGGAADASFGGDGRVVRKAGDTAGSPVAAIGVQADGRILAAGSTVNGLDSALNFAVLRWLG